MAGRHRQPVPDQHRLMLPVLATLLAVVVGLPLTWVSDHTAAQSRSSGRPRTSPAGLPASPAPSVTPAASPSQPSPSPSPSPLPSSPSLSPSPSPPPSPPGPPPTPSRSLVATLTLTITGDASYVFVEKPGDELINQLLRRGRTETFSGPSLHVRLGNAGAVTLQVNGLPPQVAGAPGQVQEFVIRPR